MIESFEASIRIFYQRDRIVYVFPRTNVQTFWVQIPVTSFFVFSWPPSRRAHIYPNDTIGTSVSVSIDKINSSFDQVGSIYAKRSCTGVNESNRCDIMTYRERTQTHASHSAKVGAFGCNTPSASSKVCNIGNERQSNKLILRVKNVGNDSGTFFGSAFRVAGCLDRPIDCSWCSFVQISTLQRFSDSIQAKQLHVWCVGSFAVIFEVPESAPNRTIRPLLP
ncbi:unnamed protein product [Albugo candida]|uniref:Uncharacterized protein n=1 Tax=Albugo candida TaxID=65357 RepID=A0A024GNK2_9STRA|nr:unnamed protein product [Albugo candida]|eukprot:CCI48370.1 unnamed protein product [Albugo candida]